MNTISGRQCALICAVMILATKLLFLPSLLYAENGTTAILSVVLIFGLEFLFLWFLVAQKAKKPTQKFFALFENKLGKFIAKIIFFVLFLFLLLRTLYILQETFSFLKSSLYTEATATLYLVCMLPVISSFAYKGLKAYGRTLEMFFLFIIALTVICTFVWAFSVGDYSFSLLRDNGFAGFWGATYKYFFWFADFLFLPLIIDNVKFDKNSKKQILGYSAFVCALVVTIMVVYFMTFQTTSFSHPYAILSIIQFVSDFGTIGKFDIVAITAVMFLAFFQLGLMLCLANIALCKVVPFGHRAQGLILLNVLLIISSYIVFNSAFSSVLFYGDFVVWLSVFCAVVVPLLFVLLAIPKKRRTK